MSRRISAEDIVWIQRALQGDRNAFDQLDRRYRPLLYARALSYLKDPLLAQEAAQDALIKGYTHLSDLETPDHFPGWMNSIVHNLCINQYRKGVRTIP